MDARIKLGVSDECVHFQAGIKKNLADYPEINIVFCSNNGDELLQQAAHNEIDIVLMESKLPIAEGNAINKMQEQLMKQADTAFQLIITPGTPCNPTQNSPLRKNFYRICIS